MSATVADYMTRNPSTVNQKEPVKRAAELLNPLKFRHLPVVDDNQAVVGIISDRDLRNIKTALDFLSEAVEGNTDSLPVKEVMTGNVKTIQPNQALTDAAKIMNDMKIGALPVVEHGKLIGIVTYSDILRAFIDRG